MTGNFLLTKSIQENMPNGNIDLATNTILNSDSPFVLACRKPICSSLYVKPVEKIVGYDYELGKPNCVQYITILSTLKVLL